MKSSIRRDKESTVIYIIQDSVSIMVTVKRTAMSMETYMKTNAVYVIMETTEATADRKAMPDGKGWVRDSWKFVITFAFWFMCFMDH